MMRRQKNKLCGDGDGDGAKPEGTEWGCGQDLREWGGRWGQCYGNAMRMETNSRPRAAL